MKASRISLFRHERPALVLHHWIAQGGVSYQHLRELGKSQGLLGFEQIANYGARYYLV